MGGTVSRVGSGRLLSLIGGFSSSTVVFGLFHRMVERADVHMSSRGGWLVSKKNMNGKNTESDKENSEKNQNGCGWVRHDDC